jgi:hypothetical protein
MSRRLIVFLACFFIMPLRGMENELSKLEIAALSRAQKVNGSQVCKQQKECGDSGYYLATYSKEGLCSNCEFKQYPERFVACVFCRAPAQVPAPVFLGTSKEKATSFNCFYCSSAIQSLLVQKLKKSDSWKQEQILAHGAFLAISKTTCTISRKYIPALKELETKSQVFKDNVPCIYRGFMQKENGKKLHIWVKDFDIAEKDKKETTWKDSENYVGSICAKYNIFGPETGEVVLDIMPENVAATYEE